MAVARFICDLYSSSPSPDCGSVGRALGSHPEGPRFDSRGCQFFFYFFFKSRASRFLRFRSTELPIIDYFAKSEAEPVSNVHTVLRKKSMKPRKLPKGKLKWLNFTRKKLHNFTEYAKTIPKKSQVFFTFLPWFRQRKKAPILI
jgi:hypothetical protein